MIFRIKFAKLRKLPKDKTSFSLNQNEKVRNIVTKELGLVYKKVGSIEDYVNTFKNTKLR